MTQLDAISEGLLRRQRVWAVVAVSAGSVLYTLDASIANVALPTIGHALNISASASMLLISVYNLVLAMVLLPLASIGDRVGHRQIFVLGLVLYLVAATACLLLASSFAWLVTARAIQAIAAGSVLSVSLAMVRDIYPATHLGRGLGINTIAASTGAAIAPALGGFILSIVSWRWVFAAGAPMALLALACSVALPHRERRQTRFDLTGALLCAMTFGLLIAGLQGLANDRGSLVACASAISGAVLAVIFVRYELRLATPVLPVDLFGRPALALSVAGALFAVVSSTALLLALPFRLSAMGFSPAAIGTMIVPYALAVTVAAPSSGMLSDRISPSVLGTVGMSIAVVAALCLAYLPDRPSYPDIAWRTALCGVGFSMFFSPNGRMVVGSVPKTRAAGASSLIATTRMFGQALGSTLLGGVLALRMGATAPALSAAVLAVVAWLLSAARLAVIDKC